MFTTDIIIMLNEKFGTWVPRVKKDTGHGGGVICDVLGAEDHGTGLGRLKELLHGGSGNNFYFEVIRDFLYIEDIYNSDEWPDQNQYILLALDEAERLVDKYEALVKECKKVLVSENIPELTFTAEYIAAGKEALKLADELGEQMLKERETGEVVKH